MESPPQNTKSNFIDNMKINTSYMIGLIILIFLLIVIFASYFENSNDDSIKNNTFLKIVVMLIFVYFILTIVLKKKIDSTKVSFMGLFKIEKGLLIYLIIIFMLSFLI
tara:strand:- start:32 stop:355 length:324 start_codon:yes stop_codon:yes gene_type:complete